MSIITMLEKLYDLERHATAHEEGGAVLSIQKSRRTLYHRLVNATASVAHEHDVSRASRALVHVLAARDCAHSRAAPPAPSCTCALRATALTRVLDGCTHIVFARRRGACVWALCAQYPRHNPIRNSTGTLPVSAPLADNSRDEPTFPFSTDRRTDTD